MLEPDGGERGARSHQRSAVHGRRGRVEQREHPLRHRQPVRAGVELRPEPPQRQVQLGRQDDHGQPGLEPEAAVHEPHPGRHGDERDAERGRQLEHRPGQEADAQGLHGRRAIALADLADDARLILGAAERPQRRQAPYHVEEMRRQPAQRVPPLARPLLGVAPDQPHEHRHQRQRQQHDQRGEQVHERDPGDHDDRDDGGEHRLRQVAREIAVQGLDAVHGEGGDLAGGTAVVRRRLRTQAPLDERQPELGQHARGGPAARDLHPPREHRPQRERRQQQDELRPEPAKRGSGERRGDDQGEQTGLCQHHQRGRDPERGLDRQQRPRRAVRCSSRGSSVRIAASRTVRPSRLRNT